MELLIFPALIPGSVMYANNMQRGSDELATKTVACYTENPLSPSMPVFPGLTS